MRAADPMPCWLVWYKFTNGTVKPNTGFWVYDGWLPDVYDTDWEKNDGSNIAGVFGDLIIGIRAEIV